MEIISEYYWLKDRSLSAAVHYPKEKSERSKIAILATHPNHSIIASPPLLELAKLGFTTVGVGQGYNKFFKDRMLDAECSMEFVRSLPGIEKVLLYGHSQGGCIVSAFQYIAMNGTKRFTDRERIWPFPEFHNFTPADGMLLMDSNHGVMNFLGIDPSVKDFRDGRERIPELDPYNPDNGYVPGRTHYSREFVDKYSKAKVKYYYDILDYCRQVKEDMRLGKYHFTDNDSLVLAGSGQTFDSNKLYTTDISLLGRTRTARPLLHADGTITEEVVRTCRLPKDPPPSTSYSGAWITSINLFLAEEERFLDDFTLTEDEIVGVDTDFNPYSTRENMKHCDVPLLCLGCQGNHEFINMDRTYDEAVTKDKTIVFLEGSTHGFEAAEHAEKYPGQFGYPPATAAKFIAGWLVKPGRFFDDIR